MGTKNVENMAKLQAHSEVKHGCHCVSFLETCNYSLDLIFTGLWIVMYSYSITKKMHLLSQIIYSCKTRYVFQTVFPSIIRSSKLRIQQRYMSKSCCYRGWDGTTLNFWIRANIVAIWDLKKLSSMEKNMDRIQYIPILQPTRYICYLK
jgi:hypothetical protein